MPAKRKADPRPAGRPSIQTPEIVDAICVRLSEGESLRSICRDQAMPAWRTVYDWCEDAEVSARIARARELGYDAIAHQALEIADTPLTGTEVVKKADGTQEVRLGDMLGHRKLQVETRLKLLAKWFPSKYGDKIQADVNATVTLADIVTAARREAT